jgi:hypothetical protein
MKKSLYEKSLKVTRIFFVLTLFLGLSGVPTFASSHAEAPLTSMDPYADNTDVYAFRSTEAGREGFVTLIANFIPLQDPSGGPQFYRFDDNVLYEIKIDNTGDGLEDITYQFQFATQILNQRTVFGHNTLNLDGIISSINDLDYNMPQTYTVRRVDRTSGRVGRFLAGGLRTPPNAVGPRITPNYEANLASAAIYALPNGGKVFAGQRDESFFIDLGGIFADFNLRSITATGGVDTLRTKNVSSIAIEVPISDLTRSRAVPANSLAADAVIGVFSTASRRATRVIQPTGVRNTEGAFRQISRLGNPLVNEVVVPLGLKDAFNSLSPSLDQTVPEVLAAVLDPELPKIIRQTLGAFGTFNGSGVVVNLPPAPRNDLANIFLFGIPVNTVTGANFTTVIQGSPANEPHEMLRLNLGIAPTPIASASRLGILGNDLAGFPNGRRVFDDVVDIEVRALLGGTPFTPTFNVAPNNVFGDGVAANCEGFLTRFPYLQTPNLGNTPRPVDFPANQNFPSSGTAGAPCV